MDSIKNLPQADRIAIRNIQDLVRVVIDRRLNRITKVTNDEQIAKIREAAGSQLFQGIVWALVDHLAFAFDEDKLGALETKTRDYDQLVAWLAEARQAVIDLNL